MKKEIPKFIKYVAIDPKTASDLCNEVYPDKPEIVGDILKDYVNFFLYDDQLLVEKECDRYEHFARNQLADDAVRLRTHAKEVSVVRAESGRLGGKRKAENQKSASVEYADIEDEVLDYIQAKKYDGNIAGRWLNEMIEKEWLDEDGEPIRDWRKRLDAYMKAVNKNKLDEMVNSIGRK